MKQLKPIKTMNSYAKNQFWAISSEGMNRILSSKLPDEARITASQAPEKAKSQGLTETEWLREMLSMFYNQRQPMQVEGGIATIHLYGPMLEDGSPLDLAQGATGYEEIRDDVEAANADPEVNAILLRVNTPGGTVAGIEETYSSIANSNKPVFGFNEGYATSAGYYLIAASGKIAASPSSMTGNIGTVLDMWDFTGLYEKMGAKRTVMTNEGADLKGTMRGENTDAQSDFLQAQINSMGEQFHDRVKENRDSIDDEVFRAGWYLPEEAAELGLIDYKASLSEFTAWIQENFDIR